ncbi:MAG TPA: ABC transporter permease [Chloroflexota bacterium]
MEPGRKSAVAPSELTTPRQDPDTVAGSSTPSNRSILPKALRSSLNRWGRSISIWLVTALLFLVSWIFQPASVGHSSLIGMLDFASVLAIAAIGQTLVVQQRGIDLSVPGMISLTVVMVSTYPNGDSSKLGAALLLAYGATMAAGLANGILVSWVGMTPIVTTLGMNAILYGADIAFTGGVPRLTTNSLQNFAASTLLGIPTTIVIAAILTIVTFFLIKKTTFGRRFEAVGANPAVVRAAGLETTRYQIGAYVAASFMYCSAGILLAGLITSPSAFQGDTYLLATVAAVVLGGTSLLGGKGNVISSAIGALFLSQLDQFVLTTGLNTAVEQLIEAAVLAVGIAIYTVRWTAVRVWIQQQSRRYSSENRGG